MNPLAERPGTVVLWDRVLPPRAVRRRSRRVTDPAIPDDAYGRALHDLSLHLSMVFHRFLQGRTRSRRRVELYLNGRQVEPWDPFLPGHAKTLALSGFAENLPGPGDVDCPVTGRPVVLPHKAQFDDDTAWRSAGYDGQWNQRQGLYIYRADRLIQAGGWCDIWQRDEHTKLLRVALAFDPELDDLFEINAAKMSVTLPPLLARSLRDHLKEPRKLARRRYSEQGAGRSRRRRSRGGAATVAPPPPATPPIAPASKDPVATQPTTLPAGSPPPPTPVVAPPSPPSSHTGGVPPRLIHDNRDGVQPWVVEPTLVGGRDVRLDRTNSLGQRIARAMPSNHPAATLLAALIVALEDALGATDSVASMLDGWTPGEDGEDA